MKNAAVNGANYFFPDTIAAQMFVGQDVNRSNTICEEANNIDQQTQEDSECSPHDEHHAHVVANVLSLASANPDESAFAKHFLGTPGFGPNQPYVFEMLYASLLMLSYLHDAILARDFYHKNY
jgi:hypothetical protein